MIYLLTFAGGKIFQNVQKLLGQTINILGANKNIVYTEKDIIRTDFYKINRRIFSKRHGFGLYIWKPYIILQELYKIADGDYIFYCDCSRHYPIGFNNSIVPVIDYMIKNNIDIMPGNIQTVRNGIHTSDDCINIIRLDHDFDIKKYKYSLQHTAGHIILKKSNRSIEFINEWLKYCQIWQCIRKKKIKSGFNNCDMAILNVLLFIYNIKNPMKPLDKYTARNHNIFLSQFANFIE